MSKASDDKPVKSTRTNKTKASATAEAKPVAAKAAPTPAAESGRPASRRKTAAAASPADIRKVADVPVAAEPVVERAAAPSATTAPAGPDAAQPDVPALQMPSQEDINRMVEEAAYYLAEKRNFAPGFEDEDWQAAKEQIMAQLKDASRSTS